MHSEDHIHPVIVSVLIRSLPERRHLLERALHSALNQSFQDFEILVSMQGDKLPEISHELLKHPKIHFHLLQKTGGRSAAGNALLEKARGKYLNFLDDDDEFLKDHLEVLVHELETRPHCIAAFSLAQEVPTHLVSFDPLMMKEEAAKMRFDPSLRSEKSLLVESYLPTQSVLFRHGPIERGLRFEESLDTLEDWVFWASLEMQGAFAFVPKITSWYRVPASPWRQRKQFLSWLKSLAPAREFILRKLETAPHPSLTKSELLSKWKQIDESRRAPTKLGSHFKVAIKELLWRLT